MSSHRVAFIGTGPDPDEPVWGVSAAMAYKHAAGYDRLDSCELVACADIEREHAAAFADRYDIPDANVYTDYEEMLAAAEPDVVSVCTPVPTHAPIVTDVAESGVPDAIHCEKPMADTWADCREMVRACESAGIQLTFNHQRRFGPAWRRAKDLLDSGAIGELRRLEMGGKNIFDYGSHLLDLCNYYVDETEPTWVLAGLDYREEDVRYGSHNENQLVAQWQYENGVHALAATGEGSSLVGCHNRLVGSRGTIEIETDDGDALRLRRGETTETVDVESGDEKGPAAIEHVVASLDAGTEPELSAANALRATQIAFGAWESVRRHGRVEFPLEIDDNPLERLVETGALNPAPVDEGDAR
jgi:predicted dehydrogenase